MTYSSIAEIPESELVKKLLRSYLRQDIINIQGIPDDQIDFQRVPLPFGRQGDIDILLCAKGQPSEAIAIEVKRVKVTSQTFRNGRLNKLQEYKKGVRQANLLCQIGFAQVYLFIFVVIDSREQNAGRISYAGLTSEFDQMIRDSLSTHHLDQRVGLVRNDFIQSMNHDTLRVDAATLKVIRKAEAVTQPDALTDWVSQIMSRHAD